MQVAIPRYRKRKSLLPRLRDSCLKRIWAVLYPVSIVVLRRFEVWFGPKALPWILGPSICWDFARRLPDYELFKSLRSVHAPAFWGELTARYHYYVMVRNWQSTLATALLCDRLRAPGWAGRIEIRGVPPHQLSEWGKRPVIVVYIHSGAFGILRHWLRSQSVPTAAFVASMPRVLTGSWTRPISINADRVNGLAGVPQFFQGVDQLRDALAFLVPGHVMTMGLDAGPSARFSNAFRVNGAEMWLNTTVVRLAAASGAVLLPASVAASDVCRFEIQFGQPVPHELIDRHNPEPAIQFIIDQLWKEIEAEPSALGWTNLEALAPNLARSHVPWP
jgi:lauroyl/myristoyl acyltransferase